MAVSIRLSRQGAKKNPQYLIVAMDSEKKRDGEYLQRLGHYFPKAKTAAEKVELNRDALQTWITRGAQMTRTVSELVKATAPKA